MEHTNSLLLEVECRSHTAKCGRVIQTLRVGPDKETLMKGLFHLAFMNLTRAVTIKPLGRLDRSVRTSAGAAITIGMQQ